MYRKLGIAGIGLLLLVNAVLPATGAAGPSAGGIASDNLEFVTTFPLHADTAGAALLGDYFYITTERDLTIYDISDPVNPKEVGRTVLIPPGDFYFPEEDPETNGKILLVGNGGSLLVIDVEDKTNPTTVATLDGADEHTISCVLDCTWAYGSEGVIVDLRNPLKPKIAGDWREGGPVSGTHDVTEVAPGLIVTSSKPMLFLDARKDPAHPKILTVSDTPRGTIHSNLWPHNGTERILLAADEGVGPKCDDAGDSTFMTWDTKNWRKTGTFKLIEEWKVKNGLPTDGNAAANLFCTHWFTTHPTYRDGGLVAIAWYESGTRLLDISSTGKITEVGWFVPWVGSTSATYWVNDEIIYAADYNRGLDILRFTGKP